MSKTTKVVLGILAGLLLVSVLSCVGLRMWFDANRDDLANMGQEAEAAGIEHGLTTDQVGCVDEALAQQADCGGFDPMCEAQNGIFLKACLSAAQANARFCDDVPQRSDIMDSAVWAVGTCANLGRPDDQACGRLMQNVQDHCHGT